MKKITLLTMVIGAMFTIAISTSAFGDTIFTGTSRSGALQLREDLQISALSNLEGSAEYLAISGTDRLYCGLSRTITVLDPATLAIITTINVSGEIRSMELKNGALYVLIEGNPAKVLVISDVSQEIIDVIEVGMKVSDMAVTSDGAKLFIAKGAESRIDIISTQNVNTGYGQIEYGEIESGRVISSIYCSGNPCSLVLNGDDSKLYVADSPSSEVIVIDTQTNNVVTRIDAGENCVKLSPAGADIYAIDRSSITKAVYIIDTSSDILTDTIQLDNVPYDAAFHPDGDYGIIVSRSGDKVYKVKNLAVVAEKSLPSPQSALIIDSTLGTIGVIYSGGKEIKSGVSSSSSDADEPITVLTAFNFVDVIQPAGGEEWNGPHDVWWFTDAPPGFYAYVSCLVGPDGSATEYPLSGGLQDKTWFKWDTALSLDSDQCKIKVRVEHGLDNGEGISPDFFTVDNTPPEVEIKYLSGINNSNGTTTITIQAIVSDNMTGVRDENPVTTDPDILISLNGAGPTYITDQSPYDGIYEASVDIISDGAQNIITVIAQDNIRDDMGNGNQGIDEIVIRDGKEIQRLINEAEPETTVDIEPGIYRLTTRARVYWTPLVIWKNITLKALDSNPDKTIIDLDMNTIDIHDKTHYSYMCSYSSDGFANVNDVTIEGLTIKGMTSGIETARFWVPHYEQTAYGQRRTGGHWAYYTSWNKNPINNYSQNLTIKDCKITNNRGSTASALYTWERTAVTLENVLIADNVQTRRGTWYCGSTRAWRDNWTSRGLYLSGATYQDRWSRLYIRNCTIANNTSPYKAFGAVAKDDWAAVTISDSILWGNTSPDGHDIAGEGEYNHNTAIGCVGNIGIYDSDVQDIANIHPHSIANQTSGLIQEDPQFHDAAGGDYTPRNSSCDYMGARF
jgi:YVTN family beta-propeller protein